jgi:hypothetical protein
MSNLTAQLAALGTDTQANRGIGILSLREMPYLGRVVSPCLYVGGQPPQHRFIGESLVDAEAT